MHLLSETMDVQLCTCLKDDLASEFTTSLGRYSKVHFAHEFILLLARKRFFKVALELLQVYCRVNALCASQEDFFPKVSANKDFQDFKTN